MHNWLYWTLVILGAGLLGQAVQRVRAKKLPPWLYREKDSSK